MASRTPTFKEFWKAYPRKRGKDKAEEVWKRMTAEERRLALAAIPDYIDDYQKNNVIFMYPQGWLNQKRWRDYVEQEEEIEAPVQGSRFKVQGSRRKAQGDSGTKTGHSAQPNHEPLTVNHEPSDSATPSLADMETW